MADTMLAGELLAMYGIRQVFGIPMEKQKIRCHEHGKPFMENETDIHFNISHSKNCVAVAVCDTRVGIDIQHTVPYRDALAKRICTPEELHQIQTSGNPSAKFTELWTQKEAVVKLEGAGLALIKRCRISDYSCATTYRDDYCLSVVWDAE